jgi:hypothetical protein
MAAKSLDFSKNNRIIMIEIDETPNIEEILICIASGCNALIGPIPEDDIEDDLKDKDLLIKDWMRELGIDGLEKIGRRNLRANNYDTAAISGLRLVGYNRSLPMWLGN